MFEFLFTGERQNSIAKYSALLAAQPTITTETFSRNVQTNHLPPMPPHPDREGDGRAGVNGRPETGAERAERMGRERIMQIRRDDIHAQMIKKFAHMVILLPANEASGFVNTLWEEALVKPRVNPTALQTLHYLANSDGAAEPTNTAANLTQEQFDALFTKEVRDKLLQEDVISRFTSAYETSLIPSVRRSTQLFDTLLATTVRVTNVTQRITLVRRLAEMKPNGRSLVRAILPEMYPTFLRMKKERYAGSLCVGYPHGATTILEDLTNNLPIESLPDFVLATRAAFNDDPECAAEIAISEAAKMRDTARLNLFFTEETITALIAALDKPNGFANALPAIQDLATNPNLARDQKRRLKTKLATYTADLLRKVQDGDVTAWPQLFKIQLDLDKEVLTGLMTRMPIGQVETFARRFCENLHSLSLIEALHTLAHAEDLDVERFKKLFATSTLNTQKTLGNVLLQKNRWFNVQGQTIAAQTLIAVANNPYTSPSQKASIVFLLAQTNAANLATSGTTPVPGLSDLIKEALSRLATPEVVTRLIDKADKNDIFVNTGLRETKSTEWIAVFEQLLPSMSPANHQEYINLLLTHCHQEANVREVLKGLIASPYLSDSLKAEIRKNTPTWYRLP